MIPLLVLEEKEFFLYQGKLYAVIRQEREHVAVQGIANIASELDLGAVTAWDKETMVDRVRFVRS